MIKAIIFDCFGVLTNDNWKEFRAEHCDTEEKKYRALQLDKAVNEGSISYDEFVVEVAKLGDVRPEYVADLFSNYQVNVKLFEYIEQNLKPKYKIGMLSNSADNWVEKLFGLERAKLFDVVTLSCDVGVVKPDQKIYQKACQDLGVHPSECVFTDDVERYCDSAESLGMKAIVYKNLKDFKHELSLKLNA